jgi:chromosome segregation ATPase
MNNPLPSYRKAFLKSPHHAWLAILTLGAGFVAAQPLLLLAGAVAYALGWIYLPDVGFFRNWLDAKARNSRQKAEEAEVSQFLGRRAKLLNGLSHAGRTRYQELANVCREIEAAGNKDPLTDAAGTMDPRVYKLDELMWTYLRLLTIQESLEGFLAAELQEDLPSKLKETDQVIAGIQAEMETLRKSPDSEASLDSRQRLLDSRQELRQVLEKRLERLTQARANLELVLSEEERLEQQIKLLRADAIAIRNTDTLTTRINATVEHLEQTNRWLGELEEYRDLVGTLPQTDRNLGFGTEVPPHLSPAAPAKSPRPTIRN